LPVNPPPPAPEPPINLSPMQEKPQTPPEPVAKQPTPPPQPSGPLFDEPKPNTSSVLLGIIAILLFLALGAAGYLLYQNLQLKNQLAQLQLTPTSPMPVPSITPNPSADWETYVNSIENFSFKYPTTWTVDTSKDKGDERSENIQVKLTKDLATIQIYANLVGIGGVGQDYQGTPIKIDGHALYRFSVDSASNNTKQVGITDSLTKSLGVFKISNKTYSITLIYPNSYSQSQAVELGNEFDQILSTFKFLEALPSPEASPSASPTPISSPTI
jgi:hypothetical protein